MIATWIGGGLTLALHWAYLARRDSDWLDFVIILFVSAVAWPLILFRIALVWWRQ